MFNKEKAYLELSLCSITPSGDISIENKEKNVVGAMTFKDDALHISFGGTITTYGWLRNFFFVKKMIPYNNKETKIRIHSGFLEAYLSVRDQIHEVLKTKCLKRNIIVSGFSLGGALAVLCAVDIQFNFPELSVECYSMGAPRVGNLEFVESYNKRVPNTYRVIFGKDIATKLPPFFFNYKHVSIKENIIHIGNKVWWKDFSVKDHNWAYYFDGIERYRGIK